MLKTLARPAQHAWLYVDSVFPVQLGLWDLRHYIGVLRSPSLLNNLHNRLNTLTTHNFNVISIEPQPKDGGVFVKFTYTPTPDQSDESLEQAIRKQINQGGSLPSWIGLNRGNIWLVRGSPWREDLNRFASPILRVTFEGPDIHEQKLYQLLRPFGRINDVVAPVPVPPGTQRSSTLTFSRIHSAAIARNVAHGLNIDNTIIRLSYQKPIQAHLIRDWIGSHPKISLPLIIFLLGTLTYTIFDPIRSLMVQGKLEDWFDYREYGVYQWLQENAFHYLPFTSSSSRPLHNGGWKERHDAESAIKAYLTDTPTTVAFVHGPQGSGKTSMVNNILSDSGRTTLVIDCRELLKATTDAQVIGSLASQTGYRPVFRFLNSMNNLIDLASVGLIGQKTGMANSLADQVQQVLTVVGGALRRVCISHHHATQKRLLKEEQAKMATEEEQRRRAKVKNGSWHDGRLDCVSGNGIMSELGVGDEAWDCDPGSSDEVPLRIESEREAIKGSRKDIQAGVEAISDLPVVVIRNFHSKAVGGMGLGIHPNSREEVLNVLANWAGTLVENQVAHVIVVSDNRENARRLATALASKPLNSIPLYDADPESSLEFVEMKLRDADVKVLFTRDEINHLQRLGGRATDLESLILKVRNGQSLQGAVDDIVARAVGELRKSAFGDDSDDAKGRPWTKEQAWKVVKVLSTNPEVPYYDILLDFPFKGDDTALRGMESAELITIGTQDGRPSTIRPGKPVYRWVFERLLNDQAFRATQEIAFNERYISTAEGTIQKYEEELHRLKEVEGMDNGWYSWLRGRRKGMHERARMLMRKLGEANRKVEELEQVNKDLKALIKTVR